MSRRWLTRWPTRRAWRVRQLRGGTEYPRLNVRCCRRICRRLVDVAARVVRRVFDVLVGQHGDGVRRRRARVRRVGGEGRGDRPEGRQANHHPPLLGVPDHPSIRPPEHRSQDRLPAPILPMVATAAADLGRSDARRAYRVGRRTLATRARPPRHLRTPRAAGSGGRGRVAPGDGRRGAGTALWVGFAGQRTVWAGHVVARPRRCRRRRVGEGVQGTTSATVRAVGRRLAHMVGDAPRSRSSGRAGAVAPCSATSAVAA